MMLVHVVPMLKDNYAYLIVDDDSKTAACVDPVEPKKILAAAAAIGVTITTSLTTHSHWDHSGGNVELHKLKPEINIIGGKGDGSPGCNQEVSEGDTIKIGSINITVMETPCHTQGHVCFYANPGTGAEEDCAVFTGDTMFVAGCGNFNAGTPQQMFAAFKKLGALPPSTKVYVGHEYTVNNLKFASYLEPTNSATTIKLAWALKQREQNLFTTPTTIADEYKTNPFLRFDEPTVLAVTKTTDGCDCLFAVRKMKDQWGKTGKAVAPNLSK
eukprot:m.22264 g.22264  ORF g.22264 m.22264 type:complete len:271 (-) comp13756_c0_seq1:415-1227(-)